jgi:hypothetical protein
MKNWNEAKREMASTPASCLALFFPPCRDLPARSWRTGSDGRAAWLYREIADSSHASAVFHQIAEFRMRRQLIQHVAALIASQQLLGRFGRNASNPLDY